MKQVIRIILGLFLLLGVCYLSPLYSQSTLVNKAILDQDYPEIINLLQTNSSIKDDKKLLLTRGIAYAELGNASKALSDLARAKTLGNKDPKLLFYIGKTYFQQGRYDKAIEWFSTYLHTDAKNGFEENDEVYKLLRQANEAPSIDKSVHIIVEYCEGLINTINDEVRPIFSRTSNNKLYYTMSNRSSQKIKGHAFEDGIWSTSCELPTALNIIGDNRLSDLSGDGQVLFFENTQGRKMYSLYNKLETVEKNIFFQAPYFPHLGDKDLQVADAQTILFSSLRQDSYGGYDVYISRYTNGRWSVPQNLGPHINSEFNEVSPFLVADGTKLFFSSDRIESLGGYDIFESEVSAVKSKSFKKAKNIGSPINSPANDLHFRVDLNGLRSVFSSDRPGGKGGLDIYMAYLNIPASKKVVDENTLSFINYNDASLNPNEKTLAIEEPSKPIKSEQEVTKTRLVTKKKSEQQPPTSQAKTKTTQTQSSTSNAEVSSINSTETESVKTPNKDKKKEKDKNVRSKKSPTKLKQVTIPTLYYTSESDLLSINNRNKLDTIIKYLELIDDSTIEFTNFSEQYPRREYELFFTVNELDILVTYLTDKGISTDRIIINSVGSVYPYVDSNLGGQGNEEHLKLNQRIEIRLYDIPSEIAIAKVKPSIPSSRVSSNYQIYTSVKDDVHYRLLFNETSRIFKNRVLSYYDDIIVTKVIDSEAYLYALGFFQTYHSAKKVQNVLIEKSLPETTIVPYNGSQRLTENEVLRLAPTHPNLRDYMNNM